VHKITLQISKIILSISQYYITEATKLRYRAEKIKLHYGAHKINLQGLKTYITKHYHYKIKLPGYKHYIKKITKLHYRAQNII
jgi:hypothetical protein